MAGQHPSNQIPVDRCEFVILFVTYLDRASACARLGALEKQSHELLLLSVRHRLFAWLAIGPIPVLIGIGPLRCGIALRQIA